jgi:hypothetical protein
MKLLALALILFPLYGNAMTKHEEKIFLQQAETEAKLTEQIRAREAKLGAASNDVLGLAEFRGGSCQERCESMCEGNGGPGDGSSACWEACTKEGYASGTCATRCGTATSEGSRACWSACTKEGYASGTCATRCGVNLSGGSAACWAACTKEGYASGTCATRCGVNTPGGSKSCWAACTKEGYSSGTCATRCGTN